MRAMTRTAGPRGELLQRREELLGHRNIVHERIAQAFPGIAAKARPAAAPLRVCAGTRTSATTQLAKPVKEQNQGTQEQRPKTAPGHDAGQKEITENHESLSDWT